MVLISATNKSTDPQRLHFIPGVVEVHFQYRLRRLLAFPDYGTSAISLIFAVAEPTQRRSQAAHKLAAPLLERASCFNLHPHYNNAGCRRWSGTTFDFPLALAAYHSLQRLFETRCKLS